MSHVTQQATHGGIVGCSARVSCFLETKGQSDYWPLGGLCLHQLYPDVSHGRLHSELGGRALGRGFCALSLKEKMVSGTHIASFSSVGWSWADLNWTSLGLWDSSGHWHLLGGDGVDHSESQLFPTPQQADTQFLLSFPPYFNPSLPSFFMLLLFFLPQTHKSTQKTVPFSKRPLSEQMLSPAVAWICLPPAFHRERDAITTFRGWLQ